MDACVQLEFGVVLGAREDAASPTACSYSCRHVFFYYASDMRVHSFASINATLFSAHNTSLS